MNEAALTKKMVRVLRERGAWALKTHGDARQSRGMSDILGCYRGYFFGLESKLPGKEGTLTELQAATLRKMKEAGGIARMVTTVQEVKSMLDQIDRVRDG